MQVIMHGQGDGLVAEIVAAAVLVSRPEDAIELMMHPDLGGAEKVILRRRNLDDRFFRLSSGLAPDILQKFVNYRMQVAIVGKFDDIEDPELQAFMRETNTGRHVLFLGDVSAANQRLAALE